MSEEATLAGQVALVTGGGRGIGDAIVQGLAERGAAVAVLDLDLDNASDVVARVEKAGGHAIPIQADVTDRAQVQSAIQQTADALGGLHILVNNVGWTEMSPFLDEDEDYWRRIIDINYTGTVYTCHAAMRLMVDTQTPGRIINIGSDAGRVGQMGESVYAGAKGAVIALTKSLAREAAQYGVLVNCVCPGPTDTPLNRSLSPRLMKAILRHSPLGRLAEPEEVAAGVLFLASPSASFVTGQILSVSGGLTMAG